MTTYQIVWFLLVGVLFTGYAILDGFDMGVGFWHMWSKKDEDRKLMMQSIGPHWDGNEVWLLTGGGATFAAFPPVYSTVFSGFYLALMLVILALVFRAVSIEFRNHDESPRWRSACDVGFTLGSVLAALLFAVALGNVLRGIPLDEQQYYAGGFFGLLNPYALLIGLVGVAGIASHGALYLALRTEGDLHEKARGWATGGGVVFLGLYSAAATVTIASQPHLLENYNAVPLLWALPVLGWLAIGAGIVLNRRGSPGLAFLSSSLAIAFLMATSAAGLFPRLVPALGDLERSLTAANASSSELTLQTMLVLALVGMPAVVGYTIWAYRAFGGKVSLHGHVHGDH